jgi:hypothetical protein
MYISSLLSGRASIHPLVSISSCVFSLILCALVSTDLSLSGTRARGSAVHLVLVLTRLSRLVSYRIFSPHFILDDKTNLATAILATARGVTLTGTTLPHFRGHAKTLSF